MRLIDIVRQADGMKLVDEDGEVTFLKLLPPLAEREINELKASIPCSLPLEVEELLRFSRGFENGPLESLEFSGLPSGFGMEDIFPHPVPIAHDGYGNYWVVDLTSHSTEWGPIFFACHDPPVIVYQCASLEHFIGEVLRFGNPPHQSEINTVHEQAAMRIWTENPGTLTVEQCRESFDDQLRVFAESLDESFLVVDLRSASLGDGFSWGRYGPKTVNRRYGEERLFAYQRKSLFERLLGR